MNEQGRGPLFGASGCAFIPKGGYCVIVNSPLALRILDKGQLKEKKMKG
jgi:hypothetical protein|tara:strand:+ start:717 stop:863 length:147 start_codon:yes stop_codon:yes gene_type:complete